MTDKYRVHEIARLNYSDIGEYIDENHTDRPLRNDILVELLNDLAEENEKLKRENESLNSQLIRLDKELFCQDCLTCKHSKSIDMTVRCANGNGITDYHSGCDFYEIHEEWSDW